MDPLISNDDRLGARPPATVAAVVTPIPAGGDADGGGATSNEPNAEVLS